MTHPCMACGDVRLGEMSDIITIRPFVLAFKAKRKVGLVRRREHSPGDYLHTAMTAYESKSMRVLCPIF